MCAVVQFVERAGETSERICCVYCCLCEDEQCAVVEFVERAGESSERFCCVYCCLCEDEQCVQLSSLLLSLIHISEPTRPY